MLLLIQTSLFPVDIFVLWMEYLYFMEPLKGHATSQLVKLSKCRLVDLSRRNVQLSKCRDVEMSSWREFELSRCRVVEMSSCRDVELFGENAGKCNTSSNRRTRVKTSHEKGAESFWNFVLYMLFFSLVQMPVLERCIPALGEHGITNRDNMKQLPSLPSVMESGLAYVNWWCALKKG